MNSIYKFVNFLWHQGWTIVNPSLNSMRNAPLYVKYFATVLLALIWCAAFGLYTAQFFYIGLNMAAHVAIISVAFLTWFTLRGFRRVYPDVYPLMRDPNFSPKCYEMTDVEKQQAASHADRLLDEQKSNNASGKKIDTK